MRRPREEEALSLEEVKRGGDAVPSPVALDSFVSLLMIELGMPRGKETTTGSYSGLLGETSTRMDVERLFLDDPDLVGVGEEEETFEALRFLWLDFGMVPY